MRSNARVVGLAALLSFAAAAVGSIAWGALLATNAKTSPSIPWSVSVMAVLLVLYWLYLSGHGWPRRTKAARALLLRARRVPTSVFAWAILGGAFALVGLAGLWIVLVDLTGNGGNPTESQLAGYPAITVALAIGMGSLVSPITEEASFRGYAQVVLERRYPATLAVAISSIFFAVWHGPTQGFFWSKLLFFFGVGVVFGTIAYLTDSTLPAIPVHIAGDLLFFIVIWPQDAYRQVVWRSGADVWFWTSVGVTVAFGMLAVLSFRNLAEKRRADMGQASSAVRA